jgi:hypothetical protein
MYAPKILSHIYYILARYDGFVHHLYLRPWFKVISLCPMLAIIKSRKTVQNPTRLNFAPLACASVTLTFFVSRNGEGPAC